MRFPKDIMDGYRTFGNGKPLLGMQMGLEALKAQKPDFVVSNAVKGVLDLIGQLYPPAVVDACKDYFSLVPGILCGDFCYADLSMSVAQIVERKRGFHVVSNEEFARVREHRVSRTMKKETIEITETRGPVDPADSDVDSRADALRTAKPAKETRSPKTVYPVVN